MDARGLIGLLGLLTPMVACLIACSPDSPTSNATETATTDDEASWSCDCVDLEPVCTPDNDIALSDCELPNPCVRVGNSKEAATCALGLLIAQEPARFEYRRSDWWDDGGDLLTSVEWEGWHYILGDGTGINSECYRYEDNASESETPRAHATTFADPEFFEDCLTLSQEAMEECIADGIQLGDEFPECPKPWE